MITNIVIFLILSVISFIGYAYYVFLMRKKFKYVEIKRMAGNITPPESVWYKKVRIHGYRNILTVWSYYFSVVSSEIVSFFHFLNIIVGEIIRPFKKPSKEKTKINPYNMRHVDKSRSNEQRVKLARLDNDGLAEDIDKAEHNSSVKLKTEEELKVILDKESAKE